MWEKKEREREGVFLTTRSRRKVVKKKIEAEKKKKNSSLLLSSSSPLLTFFYMPELALQALASLEALERALALLLPAAETFQGGASGGAGRQADAGTKTRERERESCDRSSQFRSLYLLDAPSFFYFPRFRSSF